MTEMTSPGNNVNYFNGTFPNVGLYYRTVVGEFELSDSPYGTFDQGGNVTEWNETADGSSRILRGGPFGATWGYLHASFRLGGGPYDENEDGQVGFRVGASIPEPSAALLVTLAGFGGLMRRSGLQSRSLPNNDIFRNNIWSQGRHA
jgi:hypothetical protein